MAKEIERKFLLRSIELIPLGIGEKYRQGYFKIENNFSTIRVRIIEKKAFLTIKSKNIGISRDEFEYEIPINDASFMLETMCQKPTIEKTRYFVKNINNLWEIDIFDGENKGLVVAEIELNNETQEIPMPEWISTEVTGDFKYYNSSLIQYPFIKWNKKDKLQYFNKTPITF